MQITIHRGAHQIGGCCTEIRTGQGSILIDFGDELPAPGQIARPLDLDGVTRSTPDCDGVFFTHYHGDHVGQLSHILPGIPLYMGAVAKEIFSLYQQRISAHHPVATSETLSALRPLSPLKSVRVKDIKVTPVVVDHSAYDSYMFLIEAEGKKLLHTGDYRLHGFRGKGVLTALEKYVGQVDLLITEGTTLSRQEQTVVTEGDVEREAAKVLRENKYVFLLCSSTNIDRLAAFSAAAKQAGRLFICDGYQRRILDVVTKYSGSHSPLYNFSKTLTYGRNLLPLMAKNGFCMTIRDNKGCRTILKAFGSQSLLVYSMWEGYLEWEPGLKELTESQNHIICHASGHGAPEQIKAVCDAVRPRIGVIPIHTDAPERLSEVCVPWPVIPLNDGIAFEL